MPTYNVGEELDEQVKATGWKEYSSEPNYIEFLNKHRDELQLKFLPFDIAYFVYKNRKKIYIKEIRITSVVITNMVNYLVYGCGYGDRYFNNGDDSLFQTKAEAYIYAEKLQRRNDIKYIEL
jgi:hypothetical protein